MAEMGEEEMGQEKDAKKKFPCPICGVMSLEEDINSHLDLCLNRSTVRELVRKENDVSKMKRLR